jgi:hypothetical protein
MTTFSSIEDMRREGEKKHEKKEKNTKQKVYC